ncbi:hypothetical protein DFH11DRAFT_365230 [Phellopilus nigrolimitatus]|nr:hypothetical protein DFH11DRAFT_365230 [Phellopilus nigrolimitatus]
MAHSSARLYVETYLTFSSYLFIRIAMPLLFYIPLSLSYAMISLPFKLPFGARYSYGTGFFAFFAFIYLGMCALSLALEAMVTLTTPKFVPFFLVLLIIVNISTVAIPPELQPQLYAYGAGFQFWNIQQATRTIIFNAYSHLPTNAAVLIAWVLLSCGSLSVFTWLVRAYDVRKMHRAARVGAESEVGSRCASQSYDGRRVYTTKSKDAWETGGAKQEKSKGEKGDLEDDEEAGKGCASAAVDVVTLKA